MSWKDSYSEPFSEPMDPHVPTPRNNKRSQKKKGRMHKDFSSESVLNTTGGDPDEILILEPDHPVMGKYQVAMKKHLEQLQLELTEQLRESDANLSAEQNEYDKVGAEIYGMNQEVQRLQQQLDELDGEIAEKADERAKHEKDLFEEREKYFETQQELEEVKAKGKNTTEAIEKLDRELGSLLVGPPLTDDIKIVKNSVGKAKQDLAEVEKSKLKQDLLVQRLSAAASKAEAEIAELDTEIGEAKQLLERDQTSLADVNIELTTMSVEKRHLIQQWTETLKQMRIRDDQTARLNNNLESQRNVLLEVQKGNYGLKKEKISHKLENELFMEKIKKLQSELDEEQRIAQGLKEEETELMAELKNHRTDLKSREAELLSLQAAGLKLSSKSKELQNRISEEKKELFGNITMRSNQAGDPSNTETGQINGAQNSNGQKKLLKKLRESNSTLEEQIDELENQLAKEEFVATEVQERTQALKASISENRKAIDSQDVKIAKTKEEIEKLHITIANKENQLGKIHRTIQGKVENQDLQETRIQERKLKEGESKLTNLQSLWLKLQDQLVDIVKSQTNEEAEKQRIEDRVLTLEQKKIRLSSELKETEDDIISIDRTTNDLQHTLSRLNDLVKKKGETSKNLQEEHANVKAQLTETLRESETELVHLQQKISGAKQELERLHHKLAEASAESEKWEDKIRVAKEEREELKKATSDDLQSIRVDNQRLKQRLGQLNKQLEIHAKEMEKAVIKREVLVGKKNAAGAIAGRVKRPTKAQLEKTLIDLRRKVRQYRRDLEQGELEAEDLRHRCEELNVEISSFQGDLGIDYTASASSAQLNALKYRNEKLLELKNLRHELLTSAKAGRHAFKYNSVEEYEEALAEEEKRREDLISRMEEMSHNPALQGYFGELSKPKTLLASYSPS